MNKKSNQIENELNQTTIRLDELTRMREGINTNLKTLQQDFVDGKTSLDALQSEQGKLTTLDSSIKALEAKQEELHSVFQKASLSEARQILLEKAKSIAVEAETAFNKYVEIRKEIDRAIGSYAEKMRDQGILFRSKQQEFAQTLKLIDPETIVSPQFIPSENRDSYNQINEELREIGLDSKTRNLASSNGMILPAAEFNESIILSETLLGQKKERERNL